MKHRIGDAVRQIVTPVKGHVMDMELDKATGAIRIKVENTCDEGHIHSRWLPEADFETDPDVAPLESVPVDEHQRTAQAVHDAVQAHFAAKE